MTAAEPSFDRLMHEAKTAQVIASPRASSLLRRAVCLEPSRAEPMSALGAVGAAADGPRRALVLFQRSVAASLNGDTLYNLAIALELDGEVASASTFHRRALAFRPGLAPAHDAIGRLHLHNRGGSAAVLAHRRAVCCAPNDPRLWSNLGNALRSAGDDHASKDAYETAVTLHPRGTDALINLGGVLVDLARKPEALVHLRRAVALAPSSTDGHYNLSKATDGDGALASIDRALAIDPLLAAGHLDRGVRRQAEGRVDTALASYRRAAVIEPTQLAALHNAGTALLQLGHTEEAIPLFHRAARTGSLNPAFYSDYLFSLCFLESPDDDTVLRAHLDFARLFAPAAPMAVQSEHDDPDRVLRIGYVAANFQRHPVGHALHGLFSHHDRRRFEIVAYAGNRQSDDVTRQLEERADSWVPIAGFSDEELDRKVRSDAIDILIDCTGHLPNGRLLAFARRPAPIQVGFPVYPNTSGVPTIDYRITDVNLNPVPRDPYYSECLLRLPDILACHQPAGDAPEPLPHPPSGNSGIFTFGSFNNPAKLGARTLAAWSEILRTAPRSRLMLKWSGLTPTSAPVQYLRDSGVSADRIVVRGWAPNAYEPYLDVDCCLDPVVNGGNTNFDALWMGVPVITLRGSRLFSRIGACILKQAGLDELVTDSPEAYVALARDLVGDNDRLVRLRRNLRARVASSPIMDVSGYTAKLEAAYRAIWKRRCSGLPPAPVTVGRDESISWAA